MSRQYSFVLVAFLATCSALPAQAEIIDFEDLVNPQPQLGMPPPPPLPFTNNDQVGETTFQSGPTDEKAIFNYNGEFVDNTVDPPSVVWGGWSYDNAALPATGSLLSQPDYTYQYNAAAPASSSAYAMAYYDTYTPTIPTITLPAGEHPVSVQVTNSTFTALAVQYYDGYTPVFAPPDLNVNPTFGGDWFKLTITGYDSSDNVIKTPTPIELYLADYRSGTLNIVQNWTNVDLSSLYNAHTLTFTMSSSQNPTPADPVGILTPTYVAISDLSLTKSPGDANGDGIINGQDLALVSSAWLKSTPVADVNGDGIVNAQDLALISSNWLATAGTDSLNAPSGSAVPEPGTASLIALGLASLAMAIKLRR